VTATSEEQMQFCMYFDSTNAFLYLLRIRLIRWVAWIQY